MLRDQIKADMSIFFNADEFAETHLIDGIECTILMDNEKLEEIKKENVESLHKHQVLFFIQSDELPGKPKPESQMVFDHKSYKVTSCIEEHGMYQIILGAYKS